MLQLARDGKEIRVVDDQRFSPTSTEALARKIGWLITTEEYGTWHITCRGDCTWYELVDTIFGLLDLHPKMTPISSEDFGTKAKRPQYSVLATDCCSVRVRTAYPTGNTLWNSTCGPRERFPRLLSDRF